MKKLAIFAGVMVLGAGAALASSLSVPFFLDTAPVNVFPPATGVATYITIHNNTDADIVAEVDYYDAGQNLTIDHQTPSPNTFLLPANATLAFRPVAVDPNTETVPGSLIPDMPGGETAGSATITWPGGVSEIQGRVLQAGPGTTASMFLLPPGFN